MNFFHPHILYFVWTAVLLLLVVFRGMSRRRRLLEEYAAGDGLARLTGHVVSGRRWLRGGLATTALVFMIIALAGPRYGYHWEEVSQTGVDIVIALDCSRSMLAEDVAPNRLVRAKRKIIDLLDQLSGDRVGLVAFAGEPFMQCPLTMDYGAFVIFLEALSPDFLPRGGTNPGAAVETAMSAFDFESASDKAVILITDGGRTDGPDPIEAAGKAAARNVRLYTIGVGDSRGAPIPDGQGGFVRNPAGEIVFSRLDEATLEKMAAITGGIHVRSVVGDLDLDLIYHRHIRKTMTQTTLYSDRSQVWENRFQWFTALALLCLTIEMMVPVGKAITALLIIGFGGFCLLAVPDARADSLYKDVRQGREAFEEGAYDQALTRFIEARLKDPENPHLIYNIGNAFYKKGDYPEADRHYQNALEVAVDPGLQRDILYNLGNTRFRQNDFAGAIEEYRRALDIDETDEQARDNLALAEKALEQQQQQEQQQQEQQQQDQPDGQKSGHEKDDRQASPAEDFPENSDRPADSPDDRDDQEDQASATAGEGDNGQETSGDENAAEGNDPGPDGSAGLDGSDPDESVDARDTTADPEMSPDDAVPRSHIGVDRLNRLRDKPGAAMIPAYNGRKVEQDW